MGMITGILIIVAIAIVLVSLTNVKWKGIITVLTVIAIVCLSSILAIGPLTGTDFEYIYKGSLITGKIALRMDALSGLFRSSILPSSPVLSTVCII